MGGLLIFVDLPLRTLVGHAFLGYWLFVTYKAYSNRLYKIPFIGELLAKQAGLLLAGSAEVEYRWHAIAQGAVHPRAMTGPFVRSVARL
jgi:hypothetical protein